MTRRMQILAGVSLLLSCYVVTLGVAEKAGWSVPFAVSRVYLEQNATDGDAEVVFEVQGSEGLAKLAVVSPDGRTVIDFTAPHASSLGIRQFRFESPEPRDVESVKSAYPEGVYTFAGKTASGDTLHGKSTLIHKLPATALFVRPEAGQSVGAKDLKITWTPVKNLAAYIIKIEQEEEMGANLTARLPGTVTTFSVPNGFLLSGAKYELSIGTVSQEGNISFVETRLTTAPSPHQ